MSTEPAGLGAGRDATAALIDALQAEFDGIVESASMANNDDEHDPDGSTIAFERARVAALLESARRRLASLDEAVHRVGAGSYGICELCGGAIPPERLAALPDTTACIDCARGR